VKAAKAKRSAAAQKAEAIEIVIDGHGYRVTGTDIAGRSDRPYHAALIALEKAGYGLGELIIVRPRLRTTDKHEMTLGQRLELWRKPLSRRHWWGSGRACPSWSGGRCRSSETDRGERLAPPQSRPSRAFRPLHGAGGAGKAPWRAPAEIARFDVRTARPLVGLSWGFTQDLKFYH
jgi:hypothetical protein